MNTHKKITILINLVILHCAVTIGIASAGELKSVENSPITDNKQIDLWIEQSKSSSTVEFVGNGQTVGLQFEINLPKNILKTKAYDCGVTLPTTHTATCTYVDGMLRVIVYSMSNAVLDGATVLSFGRTNLSAQFKDSQSHIELSKILVGGQGGANITPDYL